MIYVEGRYWSDFSFDLLIEKAGQSFTKRVTVNDDYYFDPEEIGFRDFELINISNLEINTFEGVRVYQFSFYVDQEPEDGGHRFLSRNYMPRTYSESWIKAWSNYSIKLPNGDTSYLFRSFNNENEHSTSVETFSSAELLDLLLYRNFVPTETESKEKVALQDYNCSLVVNRRMVVDESFKRNDQSFPEQISRTFSTNNNKQYVRETLDIDKSVSKYKNMVKDWLYDLDDGDNVYLTYISDNDDSKFVFPFVIQNNPKAFEPRKILGKKYKGEKDKSNYQIIYKDNAKAVVKTDVLNPENENIVAAFKDNPKYEMVHIPNFETEYRVLDYEDEIGGVETRIIKSTPVIDDIDVFALPEFEFEEEEEATLKWGQDVVDG